MTSQITSRHQVSASNEVIIARHTKIPKNGNSGKHGHTYGLGISGWEYLNTITPAQTMIKASSVPIDVMCPNLEIGKTPAKKLTKPMKSKLDRHGVRHRGWISEKSLGKSPSRDIA